jgi:hypothetical protein
MAERLFLKYERENDLRYIKRILSLPSVAWGADASLFVIRRDGKHIPLTPHRRTTDALDWTDPERADHVVGAVKGSNAFVKTGFQPPTKQSIRAYMECVRDIREKEVDLWRATSRTERTPWDKALLREKSKCHSDMLSLKERLSDTDLKLSRGARVESSQLLHTLRAFWGRSILCVHLMALRVSSKDIRCVRGVLEILPSWVVIVRKVTDENCLRIYNFLKNRYSPSHWAAISRVPIPDKVVHGAQGEIATLQNLPANMHVRLRLFLCVAMHSKSRAATAAKKLGLHPDKYSMILSIPMRTLLQTV